MSMIALLARKGYTSSVMEASVQCCQTMCGMHCSHFCDKTLATDSLSDN